MRRRVGGYRITPVSVSPPSKDPGDAPRSSYVGYLHHAASDAAARRRRVLLPMTQRASTESIANALVAAHADRAPQHVVDLSIVAIREGASRAERARLSDLMRLVEEALAVRRTPSS